MYFPYECLALVLFYPKGTFAKNCTKRLTIAKKTRKFWTSMKPDCNVTMYQVQMQINATYAKIRHHLSTSISKYIFCLGYLVMKNLSRALFTSNQCEIMLQAVLSESASVLFDCASCQSVSMWVCFWLCFCQLNNSYN